MLHVFCRLSAETRAEARPSFFSKRGALLNFLTALRAAPGSKLHIIFDDTESDARQAHNVFALASSFAKVDRVAKLGNSGTFRYAYDLAILLHPTDFVYFVEDDYLHTRDSLLKLCCAADSVPADYFTLYDHLVRYAKDYKFGLDLPTRFQRIFYACGHHWRPHESTCMTFGARVSTLRADRETFMRYTSCDVPQDRELFRRLEGLVGSRRGGEPVMSDPFTIRIFVPDGDPEGVRIIDRMNWTGLGIAFTRPKWSDVKQRSVFTRTGIYIRVGKRHRRASRTPLLFPLKRKDSREYLLMKIAGTQSAYLAVC